jgi:glucose/arabinose dehydrogenase
LRRRGRGRLALLATALAFAALLAAAVGLRPERYAVSPRQMLHVALGWGVRAPSVREAARLRVPSGFELRRFADGLGYARLLRPTPAGDLLVSLPRDGAVVLLERDRDGDGRADGRRTLVSGLDRPHGLDWNGGWLYVAETSAIGRVRFDPAARATSGRFERIVTGLPDGGNHWTRTLRFGPEGKLYLTVGSSCNACVEDDARRAALLRFRADGTGAEVMATGLRNTVGFDWQPGTGALFGTDNGRDFLGDDFPPCELNRIEEGGFYGWPFANGDRVPDPSQGPGRADRIAASRPPVHAFPAHSAPLGIAFIRSAAWPEAYRGAALVALHGSWNRTRRQGYKVVSLHFGAEGGVEPRDFLTGFLRDEDVIGRPVDVVEAADGAVYVSDDYAGCIYRVTPARAVPAGDVAVPEAPAADGPADAGSRQEIERGAALYERHGCGRCHDPGAAEPGVVPRPLRGLPARYDVLSLAAYLEAPAPPMPAMAAGEADRRAVAAFLLWPGR